MHFKIVQPTGFLQKYIKHYCFMESEPSEKNVSERVIPSDHLQLMLHYREPFNVLYPDSRSSMQPRSFVSGLTNSYADVTTRGEAGVIFVAFHPAGACHFIKMPLSELDNGTVDLTDVLGKEVAGIEDQLSRKRSIDEKVQVLEDLLLRRFTLIPEYDHRLISNAVSLIKQYKGRISAKLLADKLAYSSKSLERKFAVYVGKTPKQYSKLVRFQEILADFSMNKAGNLTEYAYRNGYFDQAHFTRDFKQYAGYTPKEFLGRYPCYDMNETI